MTRQVSRESAPTPRVVARPLGDVGRMRERVACPLDATTAARIGTAGTRDDGCRAHGVTVGTPTCPGVPYPLLAQPRGRHQFGISHRVDLVQMHAVSGERVLERPVRHRERPTLAQDSDGAVARARNPERHVAPRGAVGIGKGIDVSA